MTAPTRLRSLAACALSLGVVFVLSACADTRPKASPPAPPVLEGPVGPAIPSRSAAQRLTTTQYRSAIRDLFGAEIVVPAALEPDVSLDGLDAIGATRSTVSARGVEQYETAAIAIGTQVTKDPKLLSRVLVCKPSGIGDDVCARDFAEKTGRRVWRRPLTTDEVTSIATITTQAATTLGGFEKGLAYAISALLQSPNFLYRPAVGEADPENPGKKRYTGYELATRLALFLWNTVPDDALLDAAGSGALGSYAGVDKEVARMLASPKARAGLRNFVREWLRLGELDTLQKDAKVFTYFSPDLGPMAREETLRVFEDLVFDRDADVRDVITSRHTFVNAKLALIYAVPAPSADGFAPVDLPDDVPRRGLLGQVSILALYAHPTSSSATVRGKFVREKLLCQAIPAPPVDVNTALPQPTESAKTLRDRVKLHLTVPRCAACHKYMDPIGLTLETFDGIGRYRTKESGAVIDPSGSLDAATFADASGLAAAIHDHKDFGPCIARKLYQYATGALPENVEEPTVAALAERFQATGYRMRALLAAVATSPAFRILGEPQ